MEMTVAVVGLLVGTALGALVAWLAMRTKGAVLVAQLQGQHEAIAKSDQAFRDVMGRLSQDALSANNETFLQLATTRLKSFSEVVERAERKLEGIERERSESYGRLKEAADGLLMSQDALRVETSHLVAALRQPLVRGQWGEIQLRRVIELAGMLDYCDFVEQQSVVANDEAKLRPDVVVRLPGGKMIVIDAKTPLSAYLNAVESEDEETRKRFLVQHAAQVRDHLRALGSKAYWNSLEGSPDFVVMFLPGEAYLGAALQQDASMIEFGVQSRVLPASPVTLIALLRAANYGWQQEKIQHEAQEIADLGRELYARIRTMADHFAYVGTNLRQAATAYNEMVASLEGRVLVGARKFESLGSIPQKVLDKKLPALIDVPVRSIVAED